MTFSSLCQYYHLWVTANSLPITTLFLLLCVPFIGKNYWDTQSWTCPCFLTASNLEQSPALLDSSPNHPTKAYILLRGFFSDTFYYWDVSGSLWCAFSLHAMCNKPRLSTAVELLVVLAGGVDMLYLSASTSLKWASSGQQSWWWQAFHTLLRGKTLLAENPSWK